MPRRHKPTPHRPFHFVDNDKNKTSYSTEREAKEAAEKSMLLEPNLELSVYQGADGGWYLTRRNIDK